MKVLDQEKYKMLVKIEKHCANIEPEECNVDGCIYCEECENICDVNTPKAIISVLKPFLCDTREK